MIGERSLESLRKEKRLSWGKESKIRGEIGDSRAVGEYEGKKRKSEEIRKEERRDHLRDKRGNS